MLSTKNKPNERRNPTSKQIQHSEEGYPLFAVVWSAQRAKDPPLAVPNPIHHSRGTLLTVSKPNQTARGGISPPRRSQSDQTRREGISLPAVSKEPTRRGGIHPPISKRKKKELHTAGSPHWSVMTRAPPPHKVKKCVQHGEKRESSSPRCFICWKW